MKSSSYHNYFKSFIFKNTNGMRFAVSMVWAGLSDKNVDVQINTPTTRIRPAARLIVLLEDFAHLPVSHCIGTALEPLGSLPSPRQSPN